LRSRSRTRPTWDVQGIGRRSGHVVCRGGIRSLRCGGPRRLPHAHRRTMWGFVGFDGLTVLFTHAIRRSDGQAEKKPASLTDGFMPEKETERGRERGESDWSSVCRFSVFCLHVCCVRDCARLLDCSIAAWLLASFVCVCGTVDWYGCSVCRLRLGWLLLVLLLLGWQLFVVVCVGFVWYFIVLFFVTVCVTQMWIDYYVICVLCLSSHAL
jgi:hypothetical protein